MWSYEMEHKDFLGLVVEKMNQDEAKKTNSGVVRWVDAEEEDIFVPFVVELDEDKVMDAIMDYDQDEILVLMDDWTKEMNLAKCIAFIIENFGTDCLDGLDDKGLWRLAKVVAFQEVCKEQYNQIWKTTFHRNY